MNYGDSFTKLNLYGIDTTLSSKSHSERQLHWRPGQCPGRVPKWGSGASPVAVPSCTTRCRLTWPSCRCPYSLAASGDTCRLSLPRRTDVHSPPCDVWLILEGQNVRCYIFYFIVNEWGMIVLWRPMTHMFFSWRGVVMATTCCGLLQYTSMSMSTPPPPQQRAGVGLGPAGCELCISDFIFYFIHFIPISMQQTMF